MEWVGARNPALTCSLEQLHAMWSWLLYGTGGGWDSHSQSSHLCPSRTAARVGKSGAGQEAHWQLLATPSWVGKTCPLWGLLAAVSPSGHGARRALPAAEAAHSWPCAHKVPTLCARRQLPLQLAEPFWLHIHWDRLRAPCQPLG